MNLRAKFVFSMGLLGLLCLMLPGSLRADTVYTYTGKPDTYCAGGYTCTGTTPFLTVTFDTTLSGSQLDGLILNGTGVITAYVTSYRFTDGQAVDITQASTTPFLFVNLKTDSNGNPTLWSVCATSGTYPSISSAYTKNGGPACFNSFSTVDSTEIIYPPGYSFRDGANYSTPGTWSITTTPEPSTYLLLGTGLLGLLALAARSKRHAPPTS